MGEKTGLRHRTTSTSRSQEMAGLGPSPVLFSLGHRMVIPISTSGDGLAISTHTLHVYAKHTPQGPGSVPGQQKWREVGRCEGQAGGTGGSTGR